MVDIKIQENVYNLNMEDFFVMAKRINKKRSFLFVSRVLAKHLENNSHKVLYAGMLLAKRLNELFVKSSDHFNWDLDEKDFVDEYLLDYYKNKKEMVFIGFAETATGLGQSVFDRFDNSLYFHTTREEFKEKRSVLNFEEEHSHATSHKCYVDESVINNELPVILVDDEVTTGNTSLNIIKDIHEKYPRKEYVVVSILNWMTDEELNNYRIFEKENGVKIHFVYLFKGLIDRHVYEELPENNILSNTNNKVDYKVKNLEGFKKVEESFIKETGRFGLTSSEHRNWKNHILNMYLPIDEEILVVGNGEFMYVPIILAYALGDKKVKSTTRSPIFVADIDNYSIRSGIHFKSIDGKGIDNYLYNIKENQYKKVLYCIEGHICKNNINEFINKLTSYGTINEVEVIMA